jgi:hypothetical protein
VGGTTFADFSRMALTIKRLNLAPALLILLVSTSNVGERAP